MKNYATGGDKDNTIAQHRRSAGNVYTFGCMPACSMRARMRSASSMAAGFALAQALIIELYVTCTSVNAEGY